MDNNRKNRFLIKNKKQMFTVIAVFTLMFFVVGTTYAFFNYTRTGTANTITVGRISFNTTQASGQDGSINLSNAFPIARNTAGTDTDNTGDVVITISGDTAYSGGIEYLVTATAVENTKNSKAVPISIVATASNGLGTADEEYFDNRGGDDAIYKVLAGETISNNDQLLVGYIPSGATGVNGTLTIKAFFDKDLISISDTYDATNGVSDNMGTTSEWVNGRTNFTTAEWNDISVSFKVKVEAQEGTWVEEILSVNAMNTWPTTITQNASNIKEVYFKKMSASAMQTAYNNATIKADLTYNNEGKVLAWFETNQTTDNSKYNLIVASDGETYLTTGENLFSANAYNFSNLEKVEFNNINTNRVTNISGMFRGCSKLLNIDLSTFNTNNITAVATFIQGCTSLITLDLSSFRAIPNFAVREFDNLSSLETVYVSENWSTENLADNMPIFGSNTNLEGGNGTKYVDSNPKDKTYARIDGKDGLPGYFTDVKDKPKN